MTMKRHFYISENLEELELVEQELEDNGVSRPQIHVLSQNDAAVQRHGLPYVEAVLRKDVVHSMELGALIGVSTALLILATAYLAGWTATAAGWLPFIFLAIVVLGFCTWEGGLFGIQQPHYQFKKFQNALKNGNHVFFVDVTTQQEKTLAKIMRSHPSLQLAGEGDSTPEWIIEWQKNWNGFVKNMP